VRNLPAGTHRIEVRAEGFRPFTTSLEVRAGGDPVDVVARLIAEKPMQLDGVVLGPVAPAAEKATAADPAPAPKIKAASPVPEPRIGYLVVQTRPAARLVIDGKDAGRWTPIPAANPIVLREGVHTLVLETADGQRLEERVRIEAGKTARLVRALP